MKIDIRKSRGTRLALWAFFWSNLFLGVASAQIPVTDDAFTSSAAPNANYGVSLGLVVQSATANGTMVSPIEFGGSTANTYLKFDLSAVPSNVSASNLAKVNLRLYVDFVVSPGKFDIYLASGPWTEATLTANNAPGHNGAAIASAVNVTSALKYIDVDITSAWANGPPTNGLVLVPSPGSNVFVSFDSKENPLTSHDPELSISVNDASSLQLQQEITRATQAENTIATNLSNEVVRAENAEAVINNAILTEAAARIAGDSALQQTINSLFTGNVTVGGTLSGATISSGNGGFQFGNTEVLGILPGLFNLWVGQDAGRGSGANNTGSNNTATGFQTLFNNTSGGSNVANGARALYSNTTGNDNTAIGNSALNSNTTGVVNTATGNNALVSNTTGGANTGVGDGALFGNTTGSGNTSIGRLSLAGLGTDASNNTGLGTNAGNSTNSQPTTGSNNTYVGYQSNSGDQLDLSNATAIGANAQVTASNSLVLGSINGVNGATASTNVGIGTTAPQFTLDVNGTGNFTGPVTFAPNQTFSGDGSGLTMVHAATADSATMANTATTATTATTAVSATTALSAANFTGPLSGDVTGTQSSTIIAALAGIPLSRTAPKDGQLLTYSAAANQWQPVNPSQGLGTIPPAAPPSPYTGDYYLSLGTEVLHLVSFAGCDDGVLGVLYDDCYFTIDVVSPGLAQWIADTLAGRSFTRDLTITGTRDDFGRLMVIGALKIGQGFIRDFTISGFDASSASTGTMSFVVVPATLSQGSSANVGGLSGQVWESKDFVLTIDKIDPTNITAVTGLHVSLPKTPAAAVGPRLQFQPGTPQFDNITISFLASTQTANDFGQWIQNAGDPNRLSPDLRNGQLTFSHFDGANDVVVGMLQFQRLFPLTAATPFPLGTSGPGVQLSVQSFALQVP